MGDSRASRRRNSAIMRATITSDQTTEQVATITTIRCLRLIAEAPCTSIADCHPVQPASASAGIKARNRAAVRSFMVSGLGRYGPALVPRQKA
jgi:hypothetical protein